MVTGHIQFSAPQWFYGRGDPAVKLVGPAFLPCFAVHADVIPQNEKKMLTNC